MYTLVPTSIAAYATVDSLELTQPQTSPPNSTSQKGIYKPTIYNIL